ncbi:hypothetical protein GQ42DRAFT_158001 [Ramicandelaber brevisporus]|nr:hypothetical protein GQ42DRAFT_158001 [Ramicandelaber brevisporus]
MSAANSTIPDNYVGGHGVPPFKRQGAENPEMAPNAMAIPMGSNLAPFTKSSTSGSNASRRATRSSTKHSGPIYKNPKAYEFVLRLLQCAFYIGSVIEMTYAKSIPEKETSIGQSANVNLYLAAHAVGMFEGGVAAVYLFFKHVIFSCCTRRNCFGAGVSVGAKYVFFFMEHLILLFGAAAWASMVGHGKCPADLEGMSSFCRHYNVSLAVGFVGVVVTDILMVGRVYVFLKNGYATRT